MDGDAAAGSHEVARALPGRLASRRTLRAAAGSLILLASACGSAPREPVPRPPVTLTVAFPQAKFRTEARRLALPAAEFERLTTYDAHGRQIGKVAQQWRQSADGRTWRLTIAAGIRFRDGSAVSAAEVSAAIKTAAGNSVLRSAYVCLGEIVDVVPDGPRDVVITLARPCSYLLEELDVEIVRTGPAGERLGTGPYRLVSSSAEETVYEANRGYHGGAPAVDRVVLKGYATLREAWADMMRGGADVLMDVGPDTIGFLRDQSTVQTFSHTSFNSIAIAFNIKRPTLRAPEIRRALSLAVDRDELVQLALDGRGFPEDLPIWPDFWALDRAAPHHSFDPERARALLGGRRVAFTCLVAEGYALWEKTALLVQRQLRAVGVDMRLEPVSVDAMLRRIPAGDFEAAFFDPLGGPYAFIQHMFWHSPEPHPRGNDFGYRNPKVDAALDDMRSALDDESLRAALARFVTAVRADPPALFLIRPVRTQAVTRRFVLPPDQAGTDILRTIARWKLAGDGS